MKFDNWPKESLRRTLLKDYPGCKTITEALQKEISRRTAPQSDYEVTRDVINVIADHIKEFDIGLLPALILSHIRALPINNIDQLIVWRDEWLKVNIPNLNGRP